MSGIVFCVWVKSISSKYCTPSKLIYPKRPLVTKPKSLLVSDSNEFL